MLTLAVPWRIRGGRSRSMCARRGEKRATPDSAPARPMIEGLQLPPPYPENNLAFRPSRACPGFRTVGLSSSMRSRQSDGSPFPRFAVCSRGGSPRRFISGGGDYVLTASLQIAGAVHGVQAVL